MALCDYICCHKCEAKLIYDGYEQIRDHLEYLWGDENADEWTVRAYCPECSGSGNLVFHPSARQVAED